MNKKSILPRLWFWIVGLGALVWFLVRVIPKPSRASYPCQRASFPIASGFVLYIAGLITSMAAFRGLKACWLRRKYVMMAWCMIIATVGGFFAFRGDRPTVYANSGYLDTANVPIGSARGIMPGRVVWSRNPDATNENCSNSQFGDAYYLPKNTNMSVVNEMVTSSILRLTGKSTLMEAWDTLFVYFNMKKGKGAVGYQAGEKIFIRTNGVGETVKSSTDHSVPVLGDYTMARTSPQPVLALLRQLVNECGIPQKNISVGDPSRNIQNEYWDVWHTEFPDVNYICNLGGQGRVKAVAGSATSIYYSDRGAILRSGDWADMSKGTAIFNDKFYTVIEQADYVIFVAALKVHERAGMTLLGKLHFGSHTRANAMHLHMGLPNPDGFTPEGDANRRFGYHQYRILVDLLGHKKLGGNGMLFIVDGLWGGAGANLRPVKFKMAPFNNDWPSSIFMSQDPIALESVCYDLLKAEFTSDKHAETYPQMEGVDDHLHQAADSSNWPAGIRYDPENDGTVIGSLGVHEHWNNQTDMQYSRDLGRASGIELVKLSGTTGVNDSQSHILAEDFGMDANYPNPFNPITTLRYHLAQAAHVNISVFDSQGRLAATLVDSHLPSGIFEVQWDGRANGRAASSGIYFARLTVDGAKTQQAMVQRMILVK
ncbi:MAG TPA: DUF362 domain-containing protein [Bacteroidota bacterium]|nr:DUF362 domain-containing protein [Bacteroidota bacterium]